MELLQTLNSRLTEAFGPLGPLLALGLLGVALIIGVLPMMLKKQSEPFDKLKALRQEVDRASSKADKANLRSSGCIESMSITNDASLYDYNRDWMRKVIRREPVGVCAQVTPWNYPMMMAVWKWAPAIAAGNAVVLKPSDTTPASTVFMAEVMGEFLPDGVINVICGERETGKAVVEHATPAMVSITGSVRAGMEVAGSAAKQLKRVHLELGGKAPVVVFNDADLEAAAAGIAIAGFFNSGQDCTAATRVLVQEGVYEEMVKLLANQASNEIAVGMPNEIGRAHV